VHLIFALSLVLSLVLSLSLTLSLSFLRFFPFPFFSSASQKPSRNAGKKKREEKAFTNARMALRSAEPDGGAREPSAPPLETQEAATGDSGGGSGGSREKEKEREKEAEKEISSAPQLLSSSAAMDTEADASASTAAKRSKGTAREEPVKKEEEEEEEEEEETARKKRKTPLSPSSVAVSAETVEPSSALDGSQAEAKGEEQENEQENEQEEQEGKERQETILGSALVAPLFSLSPPPITADEEAPTSHAVVRWRWRL
jgi:hypothetical protein